MKEALIKYLESLSLSGEMTTLIIAALPVVELRGALPVAISVFNFAPTKAFILSVIGNMLPVVPLLVFLNFISAKLMGIAAFKRFFDWWFARTRRHSELVEKYEALGLMFFVAVPLPMTGAWSGCVAAYLLGIKFRYAFLSIFAGVIIAGVVVSLMTLGILKIF